MSTVAFLASMVDPRIAGVAAKAAIAEFTKIKDEVPPHAMESHLASISQAVKDGKKIDANYNIEQTVIAVLPDAAKEGKEDKSPDNETSEVATEKKDSDKSEATAAAQKADLNETEQIKPATEPVASAMDIDAPNKAQPKSEEESSETSSVKANEVEKAESKPENHNNNHNSVTNSDYCC